MFFLEITYQIRVQKILFAPSSQQIRNKFVTYGNRHGMFYVSGNGIVSILRQEINLTLKTYNVLPRTPLRNDVEGRIIAQTLLIS